MVRIRSVLGCLALVSLTVFSSACAAPEEAEEAEGGSEAAVSQGDLSARTERSLAQRLPTTEALDAWYQSIEEMEAALESGDPRFSLEPNRGGGTSAYVQVKRDGKTVGAFLPENSATIPLGEVRAFQLARALGVPDNVGRGVFFRMKGQGLARLASIMETERYKDAKEENRKKISAKLAAGPTSLLGVYKAWDGPRPNDYESLAKGGSPNGTINTNDPFVKLLSSSAPRPTADLVGLAGVSGGKAPQLDLARQLSSVLLIDALNGQWDRFSGGNMHAFVENGVVRFVTLDNGGVTPSGTGLAATYRDLIVKKWVTRYDRDVARRIIAMNALANGAGGEALGFRDAQALRDALMMSTDREWTGFRTGLAAVAAALSAATDASYF